MGPPADSSFRLLEWHRQNARRIGTAFAISGLLTGVAEAMTGSEPPWQYISAAVWVASGLWIRGRRRVYRDSAPFLAIAALVGPVDELLLRYWAMSPAVAVVTAGAALCVTAGVGWLWGTPGPEP